MDKKTFIAGAGREIITPPVGTCLFGYRPDWQSTSVNDDLTTTAVYMECAEIKAMLISITVCEVSNEISDRLRAAVEAETGVSAANVIISATHTHSGPNTVGIPGWGDVDRQYCDSILIPKTAAAAAAAYSNRRPAKIGIGTTQSDIGINRRQLNRDGSVSLGSNPWGLYDPTLTVIAVRGTDETPVINMVHYCCHGTAAGCNREISRDWSGPMIDRLEEQSGCMTAFFNGAEGDIGPRLSNGTTTGNITHVRELGAKAAFDALRAYRSIKEYRTDISLRCVSGIIKLPYRDLPPYEEVKKSLAKYTSPEKLINVEYLEYNRLKNIEEVYEKNLPRPECFEFRQTLVAFGPVVIIPFPWEVFVEISLRLRAYSPFQHTLSLSNTNGANSYFPAQSDICRGGYEIRTFVAGGTYCLTDDADTRIINANLELMEQLK